jgi:ferrous iron transport protein A
METGQTGIITQVIGGYRLARRLEAMGIRPGKRITKISSMFLRGPVTLKVDHTQVAIGFGMANKILVEAEDALP